jgi:hypothetical protein
MKIRTVVLITLAALLLLSGIALGQSSGPPSGYAVEQGMASGGRYRLVSMSWRASGVASGGGYTLLGPAAPASSENGCCCTWFPCVFRID